MEEADLGDGDGNLLPPAMVDPLIQCELGSGAADLCCCIATELPHAIVERPEARAYKLGKHKCSYNRVKLIVQDVLSSSAKLKISEAVQIPVSTHDVDHRLRDGCLKFQVRFTQGNKINLFVLLVYSWPIKDHPDENSSYKWIPVTRSRCNKADNPCKGPVLRGLQRFGTQKSPRNLYVAIDEASTHVCPIKGEASTFRLLLAAYDEQSHLLGSTVSSPIRVFCNNDTPCGAATLKINCNIKGGWQTQEISKRIRMPFSDLTNKSSEWLRECRKSMKWSKENATLDEEATDQTLSSTVRQDDQTLIDRPRFEPFELLHSIFSPIQIDYLQNRNPAFLYNFVRYSREMYNMYYRDTAEEVTRPTAIRPCTI